MSTQRDSIITGPIRWLRRPLERSVLRFVPLAPAESSPSLPTGFERICFHHIRKSAGTSLARSFLALGGEDPLAVEMRLYRSLLKTVSSEGLVFTKMPSRLERGDYFFGWSHLPAHRLQLPPRTFTLTVLRDPVRRVVSYYRYLRMGDVPGVPFPVPDRDRAIARGSFSEFLDRIPRSELLRQLFMFSAEYDVAAAEHAIRGCSCVMMLESYDKDLETLAARLALPLRSKRERVSAGPDLEIDETGRLREMLKPEYVLMGRLKDLVDRGLQKPG